MTIIKTGHFCNGILIRFIAIFIALEYLTNPFQEDLLRRSFVTWQPFYTINDDTQKFLMCCKVIYLLPINLIRRQVPTMAHP